MAPVPPPASAEPSAGVAAGGAPANGAAALGAPPMHLDAAAPLPDAGPWGGADAGGAIFSPGAPLTVRVAPVVGFQGLMRVQDAIARVRGVGEAGVEAYSQGEARLRLELVDPLAAAALAERLAQPARVEEASAAERSVRLALR